MANKRYSPETGWTLDGKSCDPPPDRALDTVGSMRSGRHGWPYASDAAGCAPSQIEEHRLHDKFHGCPTDYDKTGRPIMRNSSHRRKYLKSYGLHDNDAGWADG